MLHLAGASVRLRRGDCPIALGAAASHCIDEFHSRKRQAIATVGFLITHSSPHSLTLLIYVGMMDGFGCGLYYVVCEALPLLVRYCTACTPPPPAAPVPLPRLPLAAGCAPFCQRQLACLSSTGSALVTLGSKSSESHPPTPAAIRPRLVTWASQPGRAILDLGLSIQTNTTTFLFRHRLVSVPFPFPISPPTTFPLTLTHRSALET